MRFVRSMAGLHPTIRLLIPYFRKKGYRLSSIVRDNSLIHASGKALDVAPMIFNPSWATFKVAKTFYDELSRMPKIGPRIMVVGEDDHIHIQVEPPFGAGYDGIKGRILPKTHY